MKTLLAAAAIAAAFTLPAAAEAMTCTDATTGGDYSATLSGGKVKLKSPTWSANLTITKTIRLPNGQADTYVTKVNKNGIYTNVSFNNPPIINYFKGNGGNAYRQDRCRIGGQSIVQSQPDSPLDGIKQKCLSQWPGDYRMQKYCIDRQIESYNALLNY